MIFPRKLALLAASCLALTGCNQSDSSKKDTTNKKNETEQNLAPKIPKITAVFKESNREEISAAEKPQPDTPSSPKKNKTQKMSAAEKPQPDTPSSHKENKTQKGGKHKFTNRLSKEKSPYLRQHAHNPVDWYPWGKEAFDKAKKEDKPIFLSSGYSTCHWCHVMERESFENEKIAEYMNKHFVCIKIDREERPDIDKIYMNYVQNTSGRGGWPMSIFMTPAGLPFFGGTYFPPIPRPRMTSFPQLLEKINEVWSKERERVDQIAKNSHEMLEDIAGRIKPDTELKTSIPTQALSQLKAGYDPLHGGFPGQRNERMAPKFPTPSEPRYILQQAVREDDQEAIKMVLFTCDKMAAGGIYDHIGGGFARYSVDREWLVPHFEKMLYDNAQLIHLYLDAFLVSGEKKYADTARGILNYVERDMTHKDGGWFSAEDADSEGQEGKFYCWTKRDLEKLLTKEETAVAIRYYGITEEGNFEDHSHENPLKNLNVLSIADPKLNTEQVKLLASANAKITKERAKRVRPGLDDKVLSSWNGLMLGAIARAYAVLGDEKYLQAAIKNHKFIKTQLWDEKKKMLHHSWREGERDNVELLKAFAFQLEGTIHLYETTLNSSHLAFAISLAEGMVERFYDTKSGGFWQDTGSPYLIVRLKDDSDGAEPSGNSVATLSLLKLGAMTGRIDFSNKAEKTLRLYARHMDRAPSAMPYMLSALDSWLNKPWRAVIAGEATHASTTKLVQGVHQVYQPNKVVLGNNGPVEDFAKNQKADDKSALAYVCSGNACKLPTADVKTVQGYIKAKTPSSGKGKKPEPKKPEPTKPEQNPPAKKD